MAPAATPSNQDSPVPQQPSLLVSTTSLLLLSSEISLGCATAVLATRALHRSEVVSLRVIGSVRSLEIFAKFSSHSLLSTYIVGNSTPLWAVSSSRFLSSHNSSGPASGSPGNIAKDYYLIVERRILDCSAYVQ